MAERPASGSDCPVSLRSPDVQTLWREYERENARARSAYYDRLDELALDAQIKHPIGQHGPLARPHRCTRPECVVPQRKYDRMRKALGRRERRSA